MRFALLGSLQVDDHTGNRAALGAARLRVLLAALLLHANLPVSAEALAEAVWDGSAPPRSAETLRSYVRRLRRALGPGAETRIEASNPGYLIRVEPAELDILEFEETCRDTAAALRRGAWAEAATASARGQTLWRGAPLLDVTSQTLHAEFVPRLEQLRAQALEDYAEAHLRLGNNDRLVPQLRELTAQHPLRERFHAQLMLALARTGRRAEALEAYRQARLVLVEELGIEPGPELRELQECILRAEPVPEKLAFAASGQSGSQSNAPDSRLGPGLHVAERGKAVKTRDTLDEFAECLRVSGHEAILAELHRRFHDRLNEVIVDAAGQMPPGRERLMAGTLAYLDQCRRERGIQRLLAGARGEPAVRDEVARRNDEFSRLAAPDFAAMGLLPPLQAARLWAIMAAEIAIAESAAGAAQAQLRAALVAYLPE